MRYLGLLWYLCVWLAQTLRWLTRQFFKSRFQIDVDDAEDAAEDYNISALPTFIFIKNSAKVAELLGANTEKLRDLIEYYA